MTATVIEIEDLEPKFLPHGWKRVVAGGDGSKYRGPSGITVIWSVAFESDNNAWLHVSVAHPKRLPTWDELKTVKRLFVGDDKTAIQVFPPVDRYVNIHPYCLHLWHCLTNDVIPEFSGFINGKRSI